MIPSLHNVVNGFIFIFLTNEHILLRMDQKAALGWILLFLSEIHTTQNYTLSRNILINQNGKTEDKYFIANLFIYQARKYSLVTPGFLTAQFLQKR